MYKISELAAMFGLSRSTLLYYDRIAILQPSERSPAGYRIYTAEDRYHLERICGYRKAGLSLDRIRSALEEDQGPDEGTLIPPNTPLESEAVQTSLGGDYERALTRPLTRRWIKSIKFHAAFCIDRIVSRVKGSLTIPKETAGTSLVVQWGRTKLGISC